MKRIVQCPKCESKLAVFDLGKPINQKCPKCGNSFVVDSEQNKAAPAAVPATPAPVTAAPPTPVATPSTPAPVATSSAPSVVEATPSSSTPVATAPVDAPLLSAPPNPAAQPQSAPSSKEIALKKPTPRPAASKPVNDVPAAHEPIAHQGGVSFLHVMVIIGLLILTIILQVMGKKAAEKHYADLATRLNRVEAKIQSQK